MLIPPDGLNTSTDKIDLSARVNFLVQGFFGVAKEQRVHYYRHHRNIRDFCSTVAYVLALRRENSEVVLLRGNVIPKIEDYHLLETDARALEE